MRTVMIRRVRLKNILSHESSEVVFDRGLTAIVGPNGAGKSTIIDAIVYALLAGRRSTIRGSRKSDILRYGSSEGEIEVEMEAGGLRYIVKRIIRASGADEAQLMLIEGGKHRILATGVDTVSRCILEEIFGVPSAEAIRYTIIARQDELTRLLDLRPAERKELILKLLGLQDLEKARDVLRPIIRYLDSVRGKLDEVSRTLSRDEQKLKLIERDIEKAIEELKRAEHELDNVKKVREQLEVVREHAFKYMELRDKARLLEELNALEPELSKLRTLLEYEKYVRSIDIGEVRARLRDYSEVKKRIAELREKLESVDARIDGICNEVAQLGFSGECNEDNVDEVVQRALDSVRKRVARLEGELKVLMDSQSIIADSSECPVCRRPMDEELRSRVLKDMAERLGKLRSEIDKLRNVEGRLSKLLATARRLKLSRAELSSKIEEYVSRLEELAKYVRATLADLKKLRDELLSKQSEELAVCKNVGNTIEFVQCVQDLIKNARGRYMALEERRRRIYSSLEGIDRDSLVRNLTIVEGKLRELGMDPSTLSINNLERRYREVLEELRRLESRIAALRQRIDDLRKAREEVSKEIEERRRELEELRKEAEVLPIISYIHDKVLGRDGLLARELTKAARRVIRSYANAVLRSLGLDISIDITPDFDVVVRSGGNEISVRSVSGGEKTAIATALRMALAKAVMQRIPGFFVLDEPTAHLDSERREILFDLIKKISETLPQVIVATHDLEVIERADHVVEVVKIGGKSVVRKLSTEAQNTLAPGSTSPSTVRT